MVNLIGGPFDGQRTRVNPARNYITLDWEDEDVERDWDGHTVYVTRVGQARYRRINETTFEHCPTQTAMGETDVAWPETWLETQPDLEEEDHD